MRSRWADGKAEETDRPDNGNDLKDC